MGFGIPQAIVPATCVFTAIGRGFERGQRFA
jgi:hypothetical protein